MVVGTSASRNFGSEPERCALIKAIQATGSRPSPSLPKRGTALRIARFEWGLPAEIDVEFVSLDAGTADRRGAFHRFGKRNREVCRFSQVWCQQSDG